jgi:hypothetical protein
MEKTREKEKHLLGMASCLGCVTYHFEHDHRRFVCSWSFLHNYTHPETEYGTRPLTVILNSSGLALAGTVSVLKVRRAIGQENFLIPLRNR